MAASLDHLRAAQLIANTKRLSGILSGSLVEEPAYESFVSALAVAIAIQRDAEFSTGEVAGLTRLAALHATTLGVGFRGEAVQAPSNIARPTPRVWRGLAIGAPISVALWVLTVLAIRALVGLW